MQAHRIINVMFGRGLGGIEQAALDTHEALALAGQDVTTLLHPKAAMLPRFAAQGLATLPVPNHGGWDPLAGWRLRSLLHRLTPRAAIAHGNRAVRLLAKARGPRSAFTLIGVAHNYRLDSRGLDVVFCPTEHLWRAQSLPPERRYRVANLVRLGASPFPRARHSPLVIGAMGRFVAKKGFSVFLDALARLKDQGLAFNAILAGDGPEKEALLAQRARLGLAENVHFPGWIDDKPAFFAELDLFCLPSLHEPFGIALLEAMRHGVPVVASASEGPSEILAGGECGLLCPPGDPEALAAALLRLAKDEAFATGFAKHACELLARDYALDVVSEKLMLALAAACRL